MQAEGRGKPGTRGDRPRECGHFDLKSVAVATGLLLIVTPAVIFFLDPMPIGPDYERRTGQAATRLLQAHWREVLSGVPGKVALASIGLGLLVLLIGYFLPE